MQCESQGVIIFIYLNKIFLLMFVAALLENYVQYISDYQGVPFVLWTNDHLLTHQRESRWRSERAGYGAKRKGKGNENPFNNLELLNTFKSTRRHPRPPQNPKNSIPRTYLLPTATIFFSFLFLNNRQGIMANYEPKSGWPRLVHLTQTTSFELDITFYFIYLCIYIFFQNTWKLTGATV